MASCQYFLAVSMIWSATQTNHTSKCSDFQKNLIDTITTSNFYLKSKENNENDMAAQVFWAVFYSSLQPSQIGSTAMISTVLPFHPLYFSWVGQKTHSLHEILTGLVITENACFVVNSYERNQKVTMTLLFLSIKIGNFFGKSRYLILMN